MHGACLYLWRKHCRSRVVCLSCNTLPRADLTLELARARSKYNIYSTVLMALCRPPPVTIVTAVTATVVFMLSHDRFSCWWAVNAFNSLCKAMHHRSNGRRVSSFPPNSREMRSVPPVRKLAKRNIASGSTNHTKMRNSANLSGSFPPSLSSQFT